MMTESFVDVIWRKGSEKRILELTKLELVSFTVTTTIPGLFSTPGSLQTLRTLNQSAPSRLEQLGLTLCSGQRRQGGGKWLAWKL